MRSRAQFVGQMATIAATLMPLSAYGISGFAPEPGSIWFSLGTAFWVADQQYAGPFGLGELTYNGGRDIGDRLPLSTDENGGTFSNTSVAASIRVTPITAISVGAYFPFYQRSVLDLPSTRTETIGTGDIFAWIGGHLPAVEGVFGTSIFGHLKIPTSSASFETLTVPLSEGQVDVAIEEVSTLVVSERLHVSGRLLWRYRFPVDQETGGTTVKLKPGNETVLGLELAGTVIPGLWVRANYNVLFASASQDRTLSSLVTPQEHRQHHTAELGAYFDVGGFFGVAGLALDTWYRHSLAGVDFLRGPVIGVGLAYQFNPDTRQ